MATAKTHSMKKYVAVYVLLLVITALQFLIGYRGAEGGQLVVRMFSFAIIETLLVMLFWMNLGSEKKIFIQYVVFTMIFVLAAMNYIWTDSFRVLVFRLTKIGPS